MVRHETWFLNNACCVLNFHLFVQPDDSLLKKKKHVAQIKIQVVYNNLLVY